MENLNLAQKLHENIEEIKSLVTERDNLRKAEEILKLERDQLKENLQEVTAKDKVALGAKPYKEEIEDLKTKLVKTDLEKMKNAKDHEKEINSTKATIEHQKEMIRVLRENLRRNQQVQDTSMISDQDLKSSEKPLTCGGGSGIIQSTKALILKSEYVRLAKEVSKLNQQNKELTEQKNELLCENHHLCNVIKTWKERIFKREAYIEGPCENSPKSPKVTRTGSKKLNTPSQFKEWNFQDPVLKESPKSSFFDSQSKSLPACYPVCYFDNSSLGLFPEEQTIEANTVDAKPDLQPSSSRKETADCQMQ